MIYFLFFFLSCFPWMISLIDRELAGRLAVSLGFLFLVVLELFSFWTNYHPLFH
ncbi:uncharacterized protein BKA55DRAFT_572728 [Fusarium redolens]|uniref:Uncharacterized protein n=1 Tax=Fusarium redolens TaxID=48865 RepID=A0A9P9GYB9_FUSRE|nr:uncharacterized protein BKA55DRAFT_572728 [Fusarium redolens]KAH7247660.1 hypothetical protein BKA55DRAFT_572728 [Fusarium redolens]